MMGIRIAGVNFVVPRATQSNQDLGQRIGRSAEWIVRQTGVVSRHVSELHEDDPAVFAAQAARPLIEQHGPPDLLLYAGAVPRQMFPETSLFVHRELGLSQVPCFSVNAACLSFLVALKTADAYITSGLYRRILICTAELASRGRNYDEPESAALMGDGAAAVIVEAGSDSAAFEAYRMESWSESADLTAVRGGGTKRPPEHPDVTLADHRFHMQGGPLLHTTVPRLKRFLKSFFTDHNIAPSDISLVIPHQPSGPGLQLLERWGFENDRVVNIIANYGNCVAASMPMALAIAQRDGRIQSGDRLLFLGTAAGISLGAGVLRW